jgi:hypothetical protein
MKISYCLNQVKWRTLSRVYTMQAGLRESSAGDARADVSYKQNNG